MLKRLLSVRSSIDNFSHEVATIEPDDREVCCKYTILCFVAMKQQYPRSLRLNKARTDSHHVYRVLGLNRTEKRRLIRLFYPCVCFFLPTSSSNKRLHTSTYGNLFMSVQP